MERLKSTVEKLKADEGSISPLILGLFLIALILSIGIVNISDTYLAKRELINIAEEAAQKAAHSLDYSRYYLDDKFWISQNRIPLDCSKVKEIVSGYMVTSRLKMERVEVDSISCEGDQVQIKVHANIQPVLNFPIFRSIVGDRVLVQAEVSTATILGKYSRS